MEDVTLYELNNLVRSVIEQTLDDEYWLQAELSEARLAANGHFYVEFVQKDDTGRNLLARARGTMWARTYNMLAPLFERATGERLRVGMRVRVLVTLAFHELYGYSLNIVNIDPSFTLGDLAKRRREILAQLDSDGIIDDNKSLPLPALLKHVAVISSAGAAGYGDFCNQLSDNGYGLHFETRLFPAVMQGANVEESVLAALEAVCAEADAFDCVVIIRGGGATSDLSDFDSYALAAAVAQMPLPVIVGIGHERDETVLDFVAHTRVKTPTAAAAFLIDHEAQQLARLDDLSLSITQHARASIEQAKSTLDHLVVSLPRTFALVSERQSRRLEQLMTRIAQAAQMGVQRPMARLEAMEPLLVQAARFRMQNTQTRLQHLEQRIAALDPSLQLKRGYSLTFTADGQLVKDASHLRTNDILTTRLATGEIKSKVI
jgi:exodeoxyribonuclease VII large subunit